MISNDLWIIDIKTLQTINTVIEGNNQTIGDQIEKDDSWFSKSFIDKYNSRDADKKLAEELDTMEEIKNNRTQFL